MKEIFGISSDLRWLRTTIRRVGGWMQTELYLEADGRVVSVAFNTLPDREFLLGAATIRCLQIHEATAGEPDFEPG